MKLAARPVDPSHCPVLLRSLPCDAALRSKRDWAVESSGPLYREIEVTG
jgi:hypothetical protein